jgi:hypothetical protein
MRTRVKMDIDRISGYADALDAVESLLQRRLLDSGDPRVQPGLDLALASVRQVRISIFEYHLCDLDDRREDEWEDLAGTDLIACRAWRRPRHTCL